jgi:hypothetical protein
MHLFDVNNDIDGTRRRFWTTLGAVSAVTYIIAIVALTSSSRRDKLKDYMSQPWHWIRSHYVKGVSKVDKGTKTLGAVHVNEKKRVNSIFQKPKFRRPKRDVEKDKQLEAATGHILE